eukprot:ANDGO_00083.mRNA.1 hypothetical protein
MTNSDRRFPNAPGLDLELKPCSTAFDPSDPKYIQSLILLVIAGVFVGILFLLAGIVFCILRFVNNSCGGRRADSRGYPVQQIMMCKVCLTVVFVTVVSAALASYVANDQFSSAINEFFAKATAYANRVANVGQNAVTVMQGVSYPFPQKATAIETAETLRSIFNSVKANADNAAGRAAGITAFRWLVLFFTNELAVVAVSVGITSVIYRRGIPALLMALLSMFVLFLLWTVWAIHFPFGILVNDACMEVDKFAHDGGTDVGGLSYFLSCIRNSDTTDSLQTSFASIQAGLQQAQTQLQNLDQFSQDVQNMVPQTPDFSNYGILDDTLRQVNVNITDLNNAVQRNTSLSPELRAQISEIQMTVSAVCVLNQEILQLVNCNTLRELYRSLKGSLCSKLLDSLVVITSTVYVMIIALSVGVVVGIKSQKRLERTNIAKPYVCPLPNCDRGFRFRSSYIVHLRLCKKKKSFIGVGFDFISRPFVLHMNRGLRPYPKMDVAQVVSAVQQRGIEVQVEASGAPHLDS